MDIRNSIEECAKSTSKTAIAGASAIKGVSNALGDQFDYNHSYKKGDIVIYDNSLYRAKTSTSHEIPTSNFFEEVNLQDIVPEISKGSVSTTITANTTNTYHVTFDRVFSSNPIVMLTMFTGSTASADMSKITAVVDAVSTGGFDVKLHAGDISSGRAPTIQWLAIY